MKFTFLKQGICIIMLLFSGKSIAQDSISTLAFIGFVYNTEFSPLPNTYIINLNTKTGAIADEEGYFRINAKDGDHLLFRNVSCYDTIIRVNQYKSGMRILLQEKPYEIEELKVYEWGSTYEEFTKSLLEMPEQISPGVRIGITHPDFDTTEFFLREENVKNPSLLILSPVSFLYYNLSRREKIRRKAFEYEMEKGKKQFYNEILSRSNIKEISGLEGEALDEFMIYLNTHMQCKPNCTELEIISEIYYWWEEFQKVNK